MAFQTGSDNSRPLAEINITPFVDVMLVLLIIFMVATPMMESGIAIQLPKANTKALPKDDHPVVLSLSKDQKLFLGKEELTIANLPKRLAQAFPQGKTQEIFIRADAALPYGFVAKAMAAVKNAGINKIGLVTETEEK